MFALLQSDSGFSFSIGAVGVVIILVIALLVFLSPFFDWIPDLIYRLVKRRRRDEPGEHLPPPPPRHHSSDHDENA